ncbi:ESX secretion-associated protein EspG [Nocardia macrotermitis]|uniref:ESX secretion-associated protein EspG n=1 Tax=Nocardia macrotermitis TaxID=2585198 RepID=A0A7K0DA28_9NOCA|nr:ESX secretion-associated protein EspG [Nocardia macrotermitis]MQY21734.1 hypothetical protein [Nocardia macrotermitis]
MTTGTANAWVLSQLEFYTAWQAVGRDRTPFPIESRLTAEYRTDLDRECKVAARKLVDLTRADDGLYRALQALAQPQVHVMMFGYRLDGRERMVRMHAGIDAGGVGGVLVQEPGPDRELDAAGNIRVYLQGPGGAAARMVSLLPDVPPGKAHGVSINRLDLAPSETWSANAHRSPRAQAVKFLRKPYRTYVEIKVDRGAALDGWQDTGDYLRVVDFVEEGRYLITLGDRVEATPLTADKLRASIQQLIDRAAQEQRSSPWG